MADKPEEVTIATAEYEPEFIPNGNCFTNMPSLQEVYLKQKLRCALLCIRTESCHRFDVFVEETGLYRCRLMGNIGDGTSMMPNEGTSCFSYNVR